MHLLLIRKFYHGGVVLARCTIVQNKTQYFSESDRYTVIHFVYAPTILRFSLFSFVFVKETLVRLAKTCFCFLRTDWFATAVALHFLLAKMCIYHKDAVPAEQADALSPVRSAGFIREKRSFSVLFWKRLGPPPLFACYSLVCALFSCFIVCSIRHRGRPCP